MLLLPVLGYSPLTLSMNEVDVIPQERPPYLTVVLNPHTRRVIGTIFSSSPIPRT